MSVDDNSAWPVALILPNPFSEKGFQFLVDYVAANGMPKRIRTDPGFQTILQETFIKHVVFLVRDHHGNGKVDRMIRRANERLSTNKWSK